MSDALINDLADARGWIIAQILTYPPQTVNARRHTERDPSKPAFKDGAARQLYMNLKSMICGEKQAWGQRVARLHSRWSKEVVMKQSFKQPRSLVVGHYIRCRVWRTGRIKVLVPELLKKGEGSIQCLRLELISVTTLMRRNEPVEAGLSYNRVARCVYSSCSRSIFCSDGPVAFCHPREPVFGGIQSST